MKVVMISDVHGMWHNVSVPPCDLLLSMGDYTFPVEYHKWLDGQPARHVVSVQGNHDDHGPDRFTQIKANLADLTPRIHFLIEGALEIEGIKIYGTSGTKSTFKWTRPTEQTINRWRQIPDDTEILITHVPPFGILDVNPSIRKKNQGDRALRKRVDVLESLKLHAFGHVHQNAGECDIGGVHFVNASISDRYLNPVNPPRTFEFPHRRFEEAYETHLPIGAPTQG